MKGKRISFLEIFSGAGGLADGFIRAGFHPVAFVEMDYSACLTLKTRIVYDYLKKQNKYDLYKKYLWREITRDQLYSCVSEKEFYSVLNTVISQNSLKHIFKDIKILLEMNNIKKIDILLGGPPCQSYSLIGRARDSNNMKNDPRNYLYKLYVEFLKEFNPEVFVFENVTGLLSACGGKLWEDMQENFFRAGYIVDFKILNALDYGVLQNRKRIFVIGWEKRMNFKCPELSGNVNMKDKNYIVNDVLSDLPPIDRVKCLNNTGYINQASDYLKKSGIRKDGDVLTLHITHKHNNKDRQIYKFIIEKWFNEKRRPEYDELPENLKTHKNRNSFKDRFKIVAPDLSYSQTIVAHLAKDGHYFIHPDINQLRSISVREAARLQSFPDNFYFEGPMTAVFRQIGNAVPPLMAEKIALKIREMI